MLRRNPGSRKMGRRFHGPLRGKLKGRDVDAAANPRCRRGPAGHVEALIDMPDYPEPEKRTETAEEEKGQQAEGGMRGDAGHRAAFDPPGAMLHPKRVIRCRQPN
jgi:hypothetical protein